jgi:hypothetical protein
VYKGDISALVGEFIKGLPVVEFIFRVTEVMFAPRSGSPEARDKSLAEISERQIAIETGEGELADKSPLFIFAEGGTSNGTHI